ILLQPLSLAEQHELCQAHTIDLSSKNSTCLFEGRRYPLNELFRPFDIVGATVFGFQCTKESIIVQPTRPAVAKFFVGLLQVVASTSMESGPGYIQQSMLERNYDVVINAARRELPLAVVFRQELILYQEFRAD